jgi:hypothetical protein
MSRTRRPAQAMRRQTLVPAVKDCPTCGQAMWADYHN